MERFLVDEAATENLGAELAESQRAGLVWLEGDLGAGKTTLVRGWLRALGHAGPVKSPTYTIVEPYHLDGVCVYHFDLYRLSDPEELELIGVRDYLVPDNLCLVEWPRRGEGVLPAPDLRVSLENAGTGRRVRVAVTAEEDS